MVQGGPLDTSGLLEVTLGDRIPLGPNFLFHSSKGKAGQGHDLEAASVLAQAQRLGRALSDPYQHSSERVWLWGVEIPSSSYHKGKVTFMICFSQFDAILYRFQWLSCHSN